MRRMILPASLLLALSSFAMAAPIYKWVDAEGVTHFGAQPPQGAQATTVNTQTCLLYTSDAADDLIGVDL
ncbi:DUF4124 domain-containing protein, partial [Pseudomonas aeruginosa]|nr:DUF4124 domain-containing protein [Pseudomonas aeruginosa]